VRRIRRPQLALVGLVVALVIGYTVQALTSGSTAPHPGPTTSTAVPLSGLPVQARQTVTLIERGGPFPYPTNDGVVFHNAEHLLPAERDGYYREYTVPTPGAQTRGARRIVTGADGEFYYTPDHYEHFVRVDVDR
jgi:guanyl-specific ribonuclease Sa